MTQSSVEPAAEAAHPVLGLLRSTVSPDSAEDTKDHRRAQVPHTQGMTRAVRKALHPEQWAPGSCDLSLETSTYTKVILKITEMH